MDKILARAAIFEAVEPRAAGAVRKHLRPVYFPARNTIFTEGEPGNRLYIIKSGKVKIGHRSPDGRDHLLTIMGPADMFGELSVFDPGPRTSTATTITKVRAVSMDRDALRAWIAERPEVAEQLLQVLAGRLRQTNDTLTDLIFTDVPGRVAKQLLLLAQRFGTRDGVALRVSHDLTQEEIAQLAGASPEAAHRALHDFVGPRLDPVGKQQRADPQLRAPCPPSPLTAHCHHACTYRHTATRPVGGRAAASGAFRRLLFV